MTTYRVAQSGALTDQGVAHLQNHAPSLLREGFHRHEMHAGTAGGLANRLGVVAVVFAAFDVRFDVLRRGKTGRVGEPGQVPRPMKGKAPGLKCGPRWRQVS